VFSFFSGRSMTLTLLDLGWSSHFARQISTDTETLTPLRITEVHRASLTALGVDGIQTLITPPDTPTGEFATGDWVLADAQNIVQDRLDRLTLLKRMATHYETRTQLIAANVDVLFITSSCNADFNPARLERYLAMAHEAGCFPVILLTKSDLATDPFDYVHQAEALSHNLIVLAIDAHDPADLAKVAAWCKPGQTGALLGSSGTGKSTLSNGLTANNAATAAIRDDDAKGRHTTTNRSLRRMINGGWLIDTPGMRALPVTDVSDGIDLLFDEITTLAAKCKFNDCNHDREPGCAVRRAIEQGELDPDRLARWQKLRLEDAHNSASLAQSRARDKALGKLIKSVKKSKGGTAG